MIVRGIWAVLANMAEKDNHRRVRNVDILENEIEQPLLKTKENWEGFVKTQVLDFLMAHNLQAITVDDGAGKKGVIKRTANGDYKVQITSNETL